MEWVQFGSYKKLVRVVAWVLRFVDNTRNKVKGELCNLGQSIDAPEYRAAENTLFRMVQVETFMHEYSSLISSNNSKPNLVRQLKLYLDNGLIRCEGRLKWQR